MLRALPVWPLPYTRSPHWFLDAARGTAGHTNHATSLRSLSCHECAGPMDDLDTLSGGRSGSETPARRARPKRWRVRAGAQDAAQRTGLGSAGLWCHLQGERGSAADPGGVVSGPPALDGPPLSGFLTSNPGLVLELQIRGFSARRLGAAHMIRMFKPALPPDLLIPVDGPVSPPRILEVTLDSCPLSPPTPAAPLPS